MHRGFSSKLGLNILFICALLFSVPTMAAKVTKVRGKKVVIKLTAKEKGSVSKGDTLKITRKGKTKGYVKVKKVKGSKVLAIVKKGKIKKGYRAKLKKKKRRKSY